MAFQLRKLKMFHHYVKINIDNPSILEEFGNKNSGIDVCVRINPHILFWWKL